MMRSFFARPAALAASPPAQDSPVPQRWSAADPILRLALPVWLVLAGALLLSLGILVARGIAVAPETWRVLAGINAVAFAVVAAVVWLGRPAAIRAGVTFALFIQMPAPLSAFSYAVVALGGPIPLIDAHLAQIDAAMGINWQGLVSGFNQWPALITVLEAAYHGTIIAVVYVLVLLNLLGRTHMIIRFFLLFIGACLICAALSALLPAVGAYVHFQPEAGIRSAISADAGIWHLDHFRALRDGSFSRFVVTKTEGLVTFPSFHTAAALSIPLALPGLGIITATAWAAAGLILLSTVPIGGHYVVDILAGGALTLVLHRLIQRAYR